MAQNYIRQSIFNDGDTIIASLFNDEYNQLVNTFNYSSSDANATGHRHDGSTGQGGNIYRIGDLDFLNKIEADSVNNRWGFWVEVSSAAVEQLRIQDGAIVPVTDNDIDLGTSSLEFKNLYLDGTANIDSLVADTVDINGGAIDGTVIGGATPAAGSFTTGQFGTSLNVDGTVTADGLVVNSGSTGLYASFNSTNANGGYLTISSSGTVHGDIGTAAQIVSGGSASDFGINARGSRNLIFGTNNSERARIDSSGNVGIGTTTPSFATGTGLEIQRTTATATLRLEYTGSNAFELSSEQNTVTYNSVSSKPHVFEIGSAEVARIDSSGRVGIGVTPFTAGGNGGNLMIGDPATDTGAGLTIGSTTTGDIQFGDATSGTGRYAGLLRYEHANDALAIWTASSEKMRIDSSGNLLVGRNSAFSSSRAEIQSAGSGGTGASECLTLNNTGADGNMLEFYKAGTTVGLIQSRAGLVSNIILDPRTPTSIAGAGLGSSSAAICPADTSGLTDAKNNLGINTNRFKDLYLSGGVYLGGTGAANKLDDYEEGTFTATLRGSTGEPGTLITDTGAKYVKVGNIVSVTISIENVSTTGYSGDITIEGLPFAATSGNRALLNIATYASATWTSGNTPIGVVNSGVTEVAFLQIESGAAWANVVHDPGAGSRYFWVSGSYITN